MSKVLLDTDVLINHIQGEREIQRGRDSIHYSVISRCELFAGPPEQEQAAIALLGPLRELAVDRWIAELAGQLRRATRIDTPDALIAATALANELTLVTRNTRGFKRVPKLKLRPPR